MTDRLYYLDPSLHTFDATIERIDTQGDRLAVTLDRTAFYPTSGGQPFDTGVLGSWRVVDVVDEEDGSIAHIVEPRTVNPSGKPDPPDPRNPRDLPDPLAPGSMVRGVIDWPRRFDHMQQHTGQHLLSAIFQERFGLRTVSFHLGSDISTIDLRGHEPSDAILEGAERAANQVIFDDRPVNVRYGTAEELADLGVRKEVDRKGILRAIEIEGTDLQPCGGTHVRRTAQIGLLLVRRCTKIRQDWRVEFACGGRAEGIARKDFQQLQRAAEQLKCALNDVAESAERAVAMRDAHFKESRVLLPRLAEAEATLALQATAPGPDGRRLIARIFQEDAQAEYLGHFASQLAKAENTIALLAHVPCGHLFFAQHPSAGQEMDTLLKQVVDQLGGKGGGTRDFSRGRLNEPAKAELAIALGRELLSKKISHSV
jgi:alanyl-tRNA synthetase